MTRNRYLCDLRPGEDAEITEILKESPIRQRLFDIGLTKNTSIRCLFRSPMGGMKAYLIRGAVIAIRDSDCQAIIIDDPVKESVADEK